MTFWVNWFSSRRRAPALVRFADTGYAGPLGIQVATDMGNVRSNNEDCAAAIYRGHEHAGEGVMLVLADGMGGHSSGEVASRMAVERVSQVFFDGSGRIPDRLSAAFAIANREIYQAGQMDENKGMGTTCTAVIVVDNALFVAHVGDSRAYLWRGGQLIPLTIDQTYVRYLVQKGELTADEANRHPRRNVLMQALGVSATVVPELSHKSGSLTRGDVILLCSDGLYEYLSDEEMAAYLSAGEQYNAVAQAMVDEAKRRGGHDNITVLLGWMAAENDI